MTPPDPGRAYRRIFIVESRDWFAPCRARFDPARDLVLTYDFALLREIEAAGGQAAYVDHLVAPDVMQANNFRIYEFFSAWHRDSRGQDLFEYRGVPFGMSFRIDFWNDYVFHLRTVLCLQVVTGLQYEDLEVGTGLGVVEDVLRELGVPFHPAARPAGTSSTPSYFFPIHAWMTRMIRRTGVRAFALQAATWAIGMGWILWDRITLARRRTPAVYVQSYLPTDPLIVRLLAEGQVRVVGTGLTRRFPSVRYVPQWRPVAWYAGEAARQLARARSQRAARLELTTGLDVTDLAYRIIDASIRERVAPSLRTLDSIVRYLDRHPLSLAVLVANLGETVALIDCACRARGIPSYMIINGLLGPEFSDESKFATTINAYSRSIQGHYFRGMDNTLALGDPRMDRYAPPRPRKAPPSGEATVVIGASGHSNIDLNSYVAVEFDFLHDVLAAVAQLRRRGAAIRVVLKVRANGYQAQYESFVAEYFPGAVDEIVADVPVRQLLERADVYVSIYSQTLIEAACLGVPCVYYRKDTEVQPPPFDGSSPLVVTTTVDALDAALSDALRGDTRFDPFLDRSVLEHYIGDLDGRNVDRNLAQIHAMVATHRRASHTGNLPA